MSFKFRNKFPSISLCLVIEVVNQQNITMKFSPEVFINGKKQSLGIQKLYELKTTANHVFLFRVQLPKFEDNMDVVFPDGEWNTVNISYADHITYDDVQGARYSGIHVSKTSCIGDIQFSNHVKPMKNATVHPNSEGPSESVNVQMSSMFFFLLMHSYFMQVLSLSFLIYFAMFFIICLFVFKITTKRHQKDQNMVLSTLTFTSIQPLPTEDEGLTFRPALLVESDVEEETSDSLPVDEVLPTTVQHDLPVIERSSCELESNTSDSDSDDPFNLVNEKLCLSGKETMSSEDASLLSVRKAIDALEQLMIKDLSAVSSDPAMQDQLKHSLNLLTTSNHRKVTVEVKEALDKFQRKAFESFQEFRATIEPVNKLKNFEKQKARILEESSAGTYSRKDFKSSIKKASLAIKAEKSRKDELESKIANIRKQINNKEMDLEQLVLNVKNQQATLSTYSKNRDNLEERARELSKEAHNLLAANKGIEYEGKAAEVKQIMLKSTWSTDLPSQLNKIKNNIFSL